jgi:hypothetical protein
MRRACRIALMAVLFAWTSRGAAQTTLPLVKDVDAAALRQQCGRLRSVLAGAITAKDAEKLAELARVQATPAEEYAAAVQQLLDPYCLIGVSINPESRVKAARGPRDADLVRGRATLVLVKVHNEAGVTEGLKIAGAQLRTAGKREEGCWLEAAVVIDKPLLRKLTGQKLEYVVLRLRAIEAGKREATLRFDVGQGTQDLGFRAEVPVLFRVKASN